MLTLNTALAAAFKGPCDPIIYVEMTVNVIAGGTKTIKMCQSGKTLEDSGETIPAVIDSVSPVAFTVDPITRETSRGDMTIDVIDSGTGSFIRNIVETCYIKNQFVTVTVGVAGVAIADYAPHWGGIIDDIIPSPGKISLRCKGCTMALLEQEHTGLWSNKHHYEMALDIIQRCGLSSDQYTASTFAYDADATISHYIARYQDTQWTGGYAKSDGAGDEAGVMSVDATGAIVDARVHGWEMSGVSSDTSDSAAPGKIYPRVEIKVWTFGGGVTESQILVHLYKSSAGGNANLVGFGSLTRSGLLSSGCHYRVVFSAPTTTNQGVVISSSVGVSGSVWVKSEGLPFIIELAAGSYLTVDAPIVPERQEALGLVRDVLGLANASLYERESGKLEVGRFDPDTAAVANWSDDDFTNVSEIQTSAANMINRVSCKIPYRFYFTDSDDKALVYEYIAERADKQANYSMDAGTTPAVFDHEAKTDFCNGIGLLSAEIAIDAVALVIQTGSEAINGSVENHGMCCTGGVTAGPTQDAKRTATVASGRSVYLRFLDTGEIVKCSTSAITAIYPTVSVTDPEGGTESLATGYLISYTNVTRAQLGTAAALHPILAAVIDITPVVDYCEAVLNRFEDGCQIISGETRGLGELAVQVGDFITRVDFMPCGPGYDGVTTSTKWEVISKEPDIMNGRIKWQLAWTGPAVPTTSGFKFFDSPRGRNRWLGHGLNYQGTLETGFVPFFDNGAMRRSDDLFWDPTNNRLGIGTTVPDGKITTSTAGTDIPHFYRSGTAANSIFEGLKLTVEKSSALGDGHGAGIGLYTLATGGSSVQMAQLGALRNGADNSADVTFKGAVAGVLTEHGRLTKDGRLGLGITTPSYHLHMRETNANYADTYFYGSTNGGFVGADVKGTSPGYLYIMPEGGRTRLYRSGVDNLMDVYAGATLAGVVNSSGFSYLNGGNTGFGVTSDVAGKVQIGDGAGKATVQFHAGTTGIALVTTTGSSTGHLTFAPASLEVRAYDGTNAYKFSAYNAATKALELNANGDTYFNGGDFGVGLTNPTAKLHIKDDAELKISGSAHGAILTTVAGSGLNGHLYLRPVSTQLLLYDGVGTANYSISVYAGGAAACKLDSVGDSFVPANFGVGTVTPGSRLHIDFGGTNSELKFSGDTSAAILTTVAGSVAGNLNMRPVSGNMRMVDGATNYSFSVYNSSSAVRCKLDSNGDCAVMNSFGVGTLTPSEKMQVEGNVKIKGSGSAPTGEAGYATLWYDSTNDRLYVYSYYSGKETYDYIQLA